MQFTSTFRRLTVWQKAKQLCLDIYNDTSKFPSYEKFGLSSQLQRASSSVMANIAEGNTRFSTKEKLRFFNIAFSSLTEVDCLLELCKDLKYINEENYSKRVESINKTAYTLSKLYNSLKKDLG